MGPGIGPSGGGRFIENRFARDRIAPATGDIA